MKPRILITAYAVNPYKGSEDGTGWNIVREIARKYPVVAITRHNNREVIERFLTANPLEEGELLEFDYYDLPRWLSFWKKGSRGALLYHWLWHLGVAIYILSQKPSFDIAHHLNFHSDWSPSFLWLAGKPWVWGPLGHHHKIPKDYLKEYGAKAYWIDRIKWWIKSFFWRLDPFLKISKYSANRIIGVNSSVPEVLRLPEGKCSIIPAVATEAPDVQQINTKQFQVLSIGRFVPLKGFDMVIRAFADFYHAQPDVVKDQLCLTIIGKGPEKERLLAIAQECKLPEGVCQFVEWLSRSELSLYFSSSSVFFFPSHEGAGMVIPEALSYGLPILCYDNYGPGELANDRCSIRIPYSIYNKSRIAFAKSLEKLFVDKEYRQQLSIAATTRYLSHFTWEEKVNKISTIYTEIMAEKDLVPSKVQSL